MVTAHKCSTRHNNLISAVMLINLKACTLRCVQAFVLHFEEVYMIIRVVLVKQNSQIAKFESQATGWKFH